jgi:putative ABC transport system permease protein
MSSLFDRRGRRAFQFGLHGHEAASRELGEELEFHVNARAAQLIAGGMDPDEAHAEARRRLGAEGPRFPHLERSADRRGRRLALREWIGDAGSDVRYAWRGLMRRPGFTAIAVITLALGIGGNTAIFSAVRALLIRPLPFPEPERLMDVSMVSPAVPSAGGSPSEGFAAWSWPKFVVFRDAQKSFADVALWSFEQFNVTDGAAERVSGELVSARYLTTLGLRPAMGRDFPAELDRAGGASRLVIVSHAFWERHFGTAGDIIGKPLRIDENQFEVIGVMGPSFRGLSGRADVLIPITTRDAAGLSEAWSLEFSQIARLKAGVTTEQAKSEITTLGRVVYEASPMGDNSIGPAAKAGWSAIGRSLDETRVAPLMRTSLLVLFGAVGCVLLIACVNLANLLLGRALTRGREFALRLAIGARRGRLVRLLLAESVVLALLGGMTSVAIALYATRALAAVNPPAALAAQGLEGLGVVGFSDIRLDGPALLFAFGTAIAVGLLFGLAPALHMTSDSLQERLRSTDGRIGGEGRRTFSGRRVLVVAEVALAMVLLVGAGLMLRSLGNLLSINPGFDASHLVTARLSVSPALYPRDSLPGLYDRLLEQVRALPGVTHAGVADCPPLAGGCNGTIIEFPDQPQVANAEKRSVGVHFVTSGWFGAAGVPLMKGRLFNEGDQIQSPKVVLVSESAVRKFWPGQDPIGKPVKVYQGGFHVGATVIGVVGDVRFGTIDSLPVPDTYISYTQAPRPRMMIFARTANDPSVTIAPLRAALSALSPEYPAYDIRTMESRTSGATAQARLSATLLALFAGLALSLSALGIYGVISYMVAQRTREIGIRMALGADRGDVVRLVLTEGAGLTLAGVLTGLGGSVLLARLMRALLFNIAPTDPLTYGAIVLLLGGAAIAACWLPARRAVKVEPTIALRTG